MAASAQAVGRVGCQKLGALDHHVDRGRNMVLVGTSADEERSRRRRAVLRGQFRHMALNGELPLMVRQAGDCTAQASRFRYIGEKVIDRIGTDRAQHVCAVFRCQGEVSHASYSIRVSGGPYRPSQKALYASTFIKEPSSPESDSFILQNQPAPSGSSLTVSGASASAPLPSVTSPATGA